LNLHRARVRRNHGRPCPNGLIERPQSPAPQFSSSWKRASDKAGSKVAIQCWKQSGYWQDFHEVSRAAGPNWH